MDAGRSVSSSWNIGFEHNFVDPSARDYECPLCLHVMREPTITDCCGGHFCSNCILAVAGNRKECPLCRRRPFKTLVNKAVERKIADLRISCAMKDRGCPWEGPLKEAEAHTESKTGDCGFVVVDCPLACGQRALRVDIPAHLRDQCPKREVTCTHCRYQTTFDRMGAEHFVACPNRCAREDDGDGACRFERCRLDAHLSECPSQPVPCDFRDLGCNERIRRQDSFEHNTSKHLVMLYTLMLNMKKRLESNDATIKQLQETLAKERQERKNLEAELAQKIAEVTALKGGTALPGSHASGFASSVAVVLTMSPFSVYKSTQEWWEGHEFYTHPRGYKLCLCARIGPGAAKCPHLCVRISILEGDHDEELKWGRGFKAVVCIVNQLADDHHFVKTLQGVLVRFQPADLDSTVLVQDDHFISSDKLEETSEPSLQFCRDDSIKFKIFSIELQ